MITKQYMIPLPADYDMGIIRHRVATRGASFDDFPGLAIKAFLIREKGRFGAEVNEYSPFYIWHSTAHIWDFIMGPGFAALSDSFGRPRVRMWPVLDARRSAHGHPATAIQAVAREEVAIQPTADLVALRDEELQQQAAAFANDSGIAARVIGVDTTTWTLVRFTAFARPLAEVAAEYQPCYEVLHVSAPGFAELPQIAS